MKDQTQLYLIISNRWEVWSFLNHAWIS